MPLNRPTKTELLEAVREYLQQTPDDPKVDHFYRRVASNVLSIVQREEYLSESFMQQEQNLLQTFLRSNESDTSKLNQQLAQAINKRDIEITPALTNLLLQLASSKLNIDNPKYRG